MTLVNDNVQAMPVLENPVTKAGEAIAKVLEGDASAGKNALPALVAKDAAGNLQYVKVNTQNELIVDTASAEIACLTDAGNVAGSSAVEQQVVAVVLQNSFEYKDLGWVVSCFRQAEFRVVWVDDVGQPGETETELGTILVGPGDYTSEGQVECLSFQSGAAGIQELRLMGINKDAVSQLRGMIAIKEVQN